LVPHSAALLNKSSAPSDTNARTAGRLPRHKNTDEEFLITRE
jgi:hypothetical protein